MYKKDIEDLFHRSVLKGKIDEPSARELLGLVGAHLGRADSIPEQATNWLSHVLVAIGNGADPAVALRLQAPKGRPEVLDWEEVLWRYHILWLDGVAHTSACAQIATDISASGTEVDEKTVRNLYEKNLGWLYETFPRDVLELASAGVILELMCLGREMQEVARAHLGTTLPLVRNK